jgi:hypothetical protein
MGEIHVSGVGAGQVGSIGYPTNKKPSGEQGAPGCLDQLNAMVISREVLYDVVAKDSRKASRMVLKISQTITKDNFSIRQNLASRLDHAGRLVHPNSHQTLLGEPV